MKKYKLFIEDEIEGGLADQYTCEQIANKHNVPLEDIMNQLYKGIEVEMEHTDDEEIAKEIAKDHLTEYPYYYDELEKMEKKFENNRGKEMKRYKPVFTKVKEETDEAQSEKAIKDLIDLDWGKDEDAQNTALALLKGLVYADNKVADKFLQDLSDFTSKMKDEKYEEGCKKKPKKKGMKEAITGINSAVAAEQAITQGIEYLANKWSMHPMNFYKNVANGIYAGLNYSAPIFNMNDEESTVKFVSTSLSKIFKSVKERM